MCDYSGENVLRRNAKIGDQLVASRITAHTMGMISSDEMGKLNPRAVCLCEGTRLIVTVKEAMRRENSNLLFLPEVATATFHQRAPTGHNMYRDGVIFDDLPGVHISLQNFPLGTKVSVETIPGAVTDNVEKRELAKRQPVQA